MRTTSPIEALTHIRQLSPGSYAVIDVRSADEYQQEHVAGSINLPLDTVLEHTETLRAYPHVYLYCRSGNRSGQACARLHQAHIPHATSITGGLEEMRSAGFVTTAAKPGLPLQQQVLLGAGSIVTLGLVLSFTVHPWFQALSWFAGGGLMYAGLSGNCLLARLLLHMPWNRRS